MLQRLCLRFLSPRQWGPALLGLLAISLCGATANAQLVKVLKGGDLYDGLGGGGPILGKPGEVYWVKGALRVPPGKKLTLSKVTFKFDDRMGFIVQGGIFADGYFTSIHDDKVLGDTNKNGGGTIPQRGDWAGFKFASTSAKSHFAGVIRYAGRGGTPGIDAGSMTADLTVPRSDFIDILGSGIRLGAQKATIWQAQFVNCRDWPIEGHFWRLETVFDCVSAKCGKGDYIRRIGVGAWPATIPTLTLEAKHTMNKSGLLVVGNNVPIPATAKLTVKSGIKAIKFDNGAGMTVRGSVELRGSQSTPLVMTSLHDDSVLGDSNKNGTATKPKAGDWRGVIASGNRRSSVAISDAELRYAGGPVLGAIHLDWQDLDIERCKISDTRASGISFAGGAAQAQHRVVDCVFERVPGLVLHGIPVDSLTRCFGNVHGAGTRNAVAAAGSIVRSNVVLTRDNVPEGLVHVLGALQPASGVTLTVRGGLNFKLRGNYATGSVGHLVLDGTPNAPIVMTSINDDSVGGDSNGDGTRTQPKSGDWSGMRFLRQTASSARHVHLKYAGVTCSSPNCKVSAIRVDDGPLAGFFVQAVGGPIDNCIARNCREGFMLIPQSTGHPIELRHCTSAYNRSFGIARASGSSTRYRVVNSISWGNVAGNFNSLVASANVSHSCGGFAGKNGNINLDPQFADKRVLGPYTNSPCLDTAELATGVRTALDIRGNSRVCDWKLSGRALPDMGAIELVNARLIADNGIPRIGKAVRFHTTALASKDAGVAIFLLGFQDARLFLPPWGMLNVGLVTISPLGAVLTGAPVHFAVPAEQRLVGIEFAVQALQIPTRKPSAGNLTNTYRGRIHRG